MAKIIAVIPARWRSTRFEGKVLAKIVGKSMIQHVWERSKESSTVEETIIACDDERVLNEAQSFGAKAVMTSKDHESGTDRIAEAVVNIDADIIINIQGDEPLIDPKVIDALAEALIEDEESLMATVAKKIEDERELNDSNVVKVVVDTKGNALYFSRQTIPFDREGSVGQYLKHLGIYAYRKDFLMKYKDLPQSHLEETEKLEQLRVLEAGYRIKIVETDVETIGVDTKEDLEQVEAILKE